MAKRKKIDDFQEALLSNTRLMKEADITSKEEILDENVTLKIEKVVLDDFVILAKYMETSHEDLIKQALSHYLGLKSMKLESAKRKLAKEE